MKKYFVSNIVFFPIIVGIFVAPPVFAQYAGPVGQYTGPTQAAEVNTAVLASRAADGMPVTLEGYLISKIRDEHYNFRDDSGTIEVEIDREYFPIVAVSENTRVRLRGKIDKDFARDATVEVKQVEIVAP